MIIYYPILDTRIYYFGCCGDLPGFRNAAYTPPGRRAYTCRGMSAIIESAFVNTVINRERDKSLPSRTSSGTSTPTTCEQPDTMAKKISGLRMWTSKNVAQDKSEYVAQLHNALANLISIDRAGLRRYLRNRPT